jgi:chromate transporter
MLWQLFISFLQIGLFSIGGGYAAMPLIQEQVVELHEWLSMSQFTDLITIAEMTPGPIAVNSATFVGMNIAGFAGACVAVLGCIFPSLIIVPVLFWIYKTYKSLDILQSVMEFLRPVVIALIAGAALTILNSVLFGGTWNITQISYLGLCLMIFALILLFKSKFSPILIMLCCGLIGLIAAFL